MSAGMAAATAANNRGGSGIAPLALHAPLR